LNTKKIASLIRLLSSENEGEVIACVNALRRVCDLKELGNQIEGNGKSDLTKKDMQYLYEAGFKDGFEKGKKEGLEEGRRIPRQGQMFGDVLLDGREEESRVRYCADRETRLKEKERIFIESCLQRVVVMQRPLTQAQNKWLNDIYGRLGGR